MNDAAARRHPLNVARSDGAVVAHAVAMLDGSGEDVGDGLDAAMRMPRKSRGIIFRNVIAKIVQKQKRIEIGSVAEAECAAQMHARAIARRFGSDQAFYRANRHAN